MSKSNLAERECVPCEGTTEPLRGTALKALAIQLPDWDVVDGHHLRRTFKFPDFAQALAFVNRVGELAEKVGHHPDLHLSYGKATVEVWSHKAGGLTETDFVFAAKTDELPR